MATQSPNGLKNLSDRLTYALETLGLSQSELARRIDVKPQVVQYLCSNNANKSKFTYLIAEALDINATWLATGEGKMALSDAPTSLLVKKQQKIPLLKWNQLADWPNCINAATEWTLISTDHSPTSFALKMKDTSMWPRFDKDTLLIISPERTPRDQSYVLTQSNTLGEVVLRQLHINRNKKSLHPLNTEFFKPSPLNPHDQILGTLVEARWQI